MTRTRISSARPLRSELARGLLSLAAGALACTLATTAQAGSIFDFFSGGAPRTAYASPDPRPDLPVRSEPRTNIAASASPGRAFCVRLCDGRYYPIASAASNSTPVQMCSAMCPAAQTKVFRGGDIALAADSSGTRYNRLEQAFAYRKSVVPGCTCNGTDPFGLVHVDVSSDPTLRSGDLVSTAEGLKAVQADRNATRAAGGHDQHLSALRDQP